MAILSVKTDLTEERFTAEIKEPFEKSTPYIQLEYASSEENAHVYILNQRKLELLFEQGRLADFRLLSLSQKSALERFEPHLLAWGMDDQGELYALPYNNANEYPLFYNKSLFDRFEVSYPVDNMSWGDVVRLGASFANAANEKSVYALDPADIALMRMQLAVSYVDPKTGQPQMLHPDWVKIAQTLKNIYSLDGNRFPKKKQWLQFNGYFVREQSVAMGMICASCFEAKDLGFDWDIVSYPVHEDRPRWNANIAGLGLSIDSSCPDIDAAVEAVSYLVSDEHQRRNARSGIRPSLADRRIHMEFGMDSPLYYGKHTASFSQHPPAPPHKNKLERNWNKYHLVREGLIDMISNNLDVHDALHAINQKLAADAPALTI